MHIGRTNEASPAPGLTTRVFLTAAAPLCGMEQQLLRSRKAAAVRPRRRGAPRVSAALFTRGRELPAEKICAGSARPASRCVHLKNFPYRTHFNPCAATLQPRTTPYTGPLNRPAPKPRKVGRLGRPHPRSWGLFRYRDCYRARAASQLWPRAARRARDAAPPGVHAPPPGRARMATLRLASPSPPLRCAPPLPRTQTPTGCSTLAWRGPPPSCQCSCCAHRALQPLRAPRPHFGALLAPAAPSSWVRMRERAAPNCVACPWLRRSVLGRGEHHFR
jgi:hypothetical protein